MNSRFTKYFSIGASVLLTLGVSTPSIADDTELLLVDPSATVATPPNIMFIIDTSGSMGDPVDTTEPYDSMTSYTTGDCDISRLYWTKLDVVPACVGAGNVANTQFVEKSAFLCNDAILRMSGIGAYTDVMVQYRADGVGATEWQNFEIGNSTSEIECKSDSSFHGNGISSDFYAQAGAGLAKFTSNSAAELSWGAGKAAQAYTVYDGNFLNWKDNPVIVNIPKLDIVKAVNRNLMNAISDVNVGVMRFNDDGEGGRILHAISNINTNRATILATINALNDGGSTPLEESLYEAALYWRGMDADYGDLQVDVLGMPIGDIDPAAFVGGAPSAYKQPSQPVCTRNFNVLLSDGMPTSDTGAQDAVRAPNLPMIAAGTCDGGSVDGACLDDIAEYLSTVDISSTTPGDQFVITHTIGFDINLPILKSTATRSGGNYYLADDVETLTTAMMRIVENILDKGLSFSAPAVAVNTFNRTQNLNDIYMSTFLPDSKVHWSGNLKKYTIAGGVIKDSKTPPEDAIDPLTGFFDASAKSFWTVGAADGDSVLLGGAANKLPSPATRRIFTNYGSTNNLTSGDNIISTSNTSLTLADFGLTGATGEPTLADVVNWTLGEDVLDVDNDPLTTQRNTMGDPLHSQPAAVVYGTDPLNPDVVVFTATNDGYFHAIDGTTGIELWSFIPKQLLQDLPELMLNGNSTFKHYGIDGDIVPVFTDFNDNGIIDGADFVYVIFGMRRGGNDYFALDVTDKDNPTLLWQKTFPEFGESWSRPVVARVDMNVTFSPTNTTLKAVVIMGEGYDTVHDTSALPATADNVGAGIVMLDLITGDRLWRAGRSGADLNIAAMTRSFPSQVRVIDFTGDGFVDRMYAVDVGGQLFRFDVFRGQNAANTVKGGVIARFGGEGIATAGTLSTRRFYSSPDVSIFSDPVLNRRFLAIGLGSGYRAHPLDTSATDTYYSLRDPDVFAKLTTAAYASYDVAEDGDMHEISGQLNTVIGTSDRGWKFTMPTGQAILSSSATFDNSVFFLGFAPDVASASTCQVKQGENFLYRVNVANGDPVVDNLGIVTPLTSDAARVTPLQQGGIAPTPSFLFPSADSSCTGTDCSPPPIGCVGVECFDPNFRNNLVRTLWTQDGIE
jgi:type IV pilus assembly protein PilY1